MKLYIVTNEIKRQKSFIHVFYIICCTQLPPFQIKTFSYLLFVSDPEDKYSANYERRFLTARELCARELRQNIDNYT